MGKRFLILILGLSLSSASFAAFVDVNPGESLQAAINSATAGDTIRLVAGIYQGNIDFKGKAITIRGLGKDSVIQGDGTRATVIFNSGEGSETLLDQVQITGGFRGGGILVESSSPHITRCWVINNRAIGAGSGIFIFGEDDNGNSAAFFNNVIALNKTRSARPGNIANAVQIESSSPSFINNTIIKNDHSAFFITGDSNPRITNNIIALNGFIDAPGNPKKRGRGIEMDNFFGDLQVDHNLFYKNRLSDFTVDGEDLGKVDAVTEETLVGQGVNVTLAENLSADPEFVQIKALKNLRLDENSSAINAGDPDSLFNDLDDTRNDIGATGGLFTNPDLL
jgi:parallel beta-helix repeat protein